MRIIGLTGGIATGKSTVSDILRGHQFPIVDADVIARQVVLPGTPGFRKIVKAFGTDVLDQETGLLDRPKLAQRVFSDASARSTVNQATHPYIRLEMLRQLLGHFLRGNSAVILDTPLLFEAGIVKWVHLIMVVYVPQDIQKERLMSRDLISSTAAQQRIESQMSIETKRERADIVIDNTGTKPETRENVSRVLSQLKPSSYLVTAFTWIVFFWPAAFGYVGLSALKALKL
ncbi:dephospho-CoA kinase-domain-containing protein [Obelidium mucronatum]|nr:dephospho-CoA kinase-domain-containing protein [Obelidium mucronatum]